MCACTAPTSTLKSARDRDDAIGKLAGPKPNSGRSSIWRNASSQMSGRLSYGLSAGSSTVPKRSRTTSTAGVSPPKLPTLKPRITPTIATTARMRHVRGTSTSSATTPSPAPIHAPRESESASAAEASAAVTSAPSR